MCYARVYEIRMQCVWRCYNNTMNILTRLALHTIAESVFVSSSIQVYINVYIYSSVRIFKTKVENVLSIFL